jgi:lysophospholipase L1-like esterase
VRGLLFTLPFLATNAGATALPFEFDFGDRPAYDSTRGFGFEPGAPGKFSVQVPEGNYRVTLRIAGNGKRATAKILAEQRRLMFEDLNMARGKVVERSFIVNVRGPELPSLPANATGGTGVRLKPREIDSYSWDDKLTLEVAGDAQIKWLRIAPAQVPTLYLAGDSTVTDQPVAPGASWGQMLTRFFAADIAVANHAESGETLKSFLTELRLDKLLSNLRAGDWVMIQFGHNDQKIQWPQTYAEAATTYRSYLRTYIAEVRLRGATPILVTSPERRNFDASNHIVDSLGEYPEAVRAIAREQAVALLDLNSMSRSFYEALGPERAPHAFADDGRDRTHHNEYGAYALARMIVEGIRAADPALTAGLANHLAPDAGHFDPTHPPLPHP